MELFEILSLMILRVRIHARKYKETLINVDHIGSLKDVKWNSHAGG